MKRALVCACVLWTGATVRAEINVVDSLEWMMTDAPLVVKGKVTRHKDTAGPGAVVYRDLVIAVQDILKGPVEGKSLKVRLRLLGQDAAGKDWQESGHTFLFFLRPGGDGDAALQGHWALREARQSVIDLDRSQRVYLAEMRLAKSAKEILDRARAYAARNAPPRVVGAPNVFKPQVGFVRLEIPFDAEIHRHVYAGSTCYLNVPAEEKYRALALAKVRAADYHTRAAGADLLRNYPGKETVKILTALLQDPGEARWTGADGRIVEVTYPVRAAAYDALRQLGETPKQPLLKRPPTKAEAQKARAAPRK